MKMLKNTLSGIVFTSLNIKYNFVSVRIEKNALNKCIFNTALVSRKYEVRHEMGKEQ